MAIIQRVQQFRENMVPQVNILKFQTPYTILFGFFMHLFPKILGEKANILDPDQMAPLGAVWSGPALFAYVIFLENLVYKILGHLTLVLLIVGLSVGLVLLIGYILPLQTV